MLKSYRDQFRDANKASAYESEEYAPNSYGQLLWELEQAQLSSLIKEFRRSHHRIDYLDFACGTGRVISFLQDQMDSVTGIEISEAMASIAREKLRRGRIICQDVTLDSSPLEGTYDVITAFRFFLNAEPSLRAAAMRALATRLKDKESWLILNNHGHLFSHKLFLWPFHSVRAFGKPRRPHGNYLTDFQIHKIARAAGLQIVRTLGCGILGAKIAGAMSFDRALRCERRLESSFVSSIGVNKMYVARRIE